MLSLRVDLLGVELDRRVGKDLLLRGWLRTAPHWAILSMLDAQRGGARSEGDVVLGEGEALRQNLDRLDRTTMLAAGVAHHKDSLIGRAHRCLSFCLSEQTHTAAQEAERHFHFRLPTPRAREAREWVVVHRQHGNAVAVRDLLERDDQTRRDRDRPNRAGRAVGRTQRRVDLAEGEAPNARKRAWQHLLRHGRAWRMLADATELACEAPLEVSADGGALRVQRPERSVTRFAKLLALADLLLLEAALALLELEMHARLLEPPLAFGRRLLALPLGDLSEQLRWQI